MIKQDNQRQLRKKKGLFHFIFPKHSPLLKEIGVETQARSLETGIKAETMMDAA